MSLRFDGDVVIITGAGNGLGREYAMYAAARGAKVVVNDYGGDSQGNAGTIDVAQRVVDEIERQGGTAVADATDVGLHNAGDQIIDLALRHWGKVDVVVNNAGAVRTESGVVTISDDDMLRVIAIHTLGSFRLARAAWPHMVRAGGGRIVNTSSDSIWGAPAISYVTAKSAVFGLTRALAVEGSPLGIRVNTVLPSAWTRLTASAPDGDFRDTVEKIFAPTGAVPLVAALMHSSCTADGIAFQAGGQRAGEVFLGVTAGYVSSGAADPATDMAEHLGVVRDRIEWDAPASMEDAVGRMIARITAAQ